MLYGLWAIFCRNLVHKAEKRKIVSIKFMLSVEQVSSNNLGLMVFFLNLLNTKINFSIQQLHTKNMHNSFPHFNLSK